MGLKEIGEFGFIERISRGCLIRPAMIVRSIGDDAAAFRTEPDSLMLLTTDLLVERVHFLRHACSGFDLGYKSLAVNLSDIAAMGGTARDAFVSIAIPDDCTLEYLDELYRGIRHLAAKFEVNILGGDTTRSRADLIINIAVTGYVGEREIMRRDQARPGDIIISTGSLGDSRAGLHLILNDIPAASPEYLDLLNAHLLPKPYLDEGRFLAASGVVHSAIDVSDGLSSDLAHILRESGVGAKLHAEKLPISTELRIFCSDFNFNPIEMALAGGEDYTLLCTVDPAAVEGLADSYRNTFRSALIPIGEITASGTIELVAADGTATDLPSSGWDHFKEK